jgi:RNA polymerase sigma-70 factor (family 1)
LNNCYVVKIMNRRVELFEDIFYATNNKLYGFIKRLLHDDSKVQDCMQQCYMKLWEVMDQVDMQQDILPLLYTYARNLTIDSLRRNARYLWVEDLAVFSEQLSDDDSTHHYLAQKDTSLQIEALLKPLPPRRREVFKLIKLNGYSYREVAEQMQISVSTVEKHMHEAYKLLYQE